MAEKSIAALITAFSILVLLALICLFLRPGKELFGIAKSSFPPMKEPQPPLFTNAFPKTRFKKPTWYKNATETPEDLMHGTSLVTINHTPSRRFPAAWENEMNWYDTMPMLPASLGTNNGKLGKNKCIC